MVQHRRVACLYTHSHMHAHAENTHTFNYKCGESVRARLRLRNSPGKLEHSRPMRDPKEAAPDMMRRANLADKSTHSRPQL